MLYQIKNFGILFLITVWLTSCGNKSNGNINTSGLKDLETKEKSLLDELKPFVKDYKADYLAKSYMTDNRIFADTPLYKLQPKLQQLLIDIGNIEEYIKSHNHSSDKRYVLYQPFLQDTDKLKDLEGLKKWLELKKVTKEKYERTLGISSTTK